MKSFLIAFAVLFGVASCITFKQEVTEKLDHCVAVLNQAKMNATAQGFGLYQKYFDNLQFVVDQQRPKVKALSENAKAHDADNWALFEVITDLFNLVNKAVKEPFPTEHLKASVLYLSGMKASKEVELSSRLIDQVFDVIDQEIIVSTHPNGWVHETVGPNKGNADAAKLKAMYEAMEKTVKNFKVPTFEDHYNLANKVNKMVDGYNKNNRTAEGKFIWETVRYFNYLSFELAKMFPIVTKTVAQQYKTKAIQHFDVRNRLISTPSAEPSYKQTLLDRLDAAWKQMDVAMVKFSTQGFRYYFDVLNGFRPKFAKTREVIVRVVSDDAEKGDQTADTYEYEVRSHENTVKALLQNPNPEARIKSYALYAAATNPKPSADMFLKMVESLIEFQENAYKDLPTGPSSFDKIARQAATEAVQKKYTELRGLLAKYVVKTQEDFEKLISKGNERVVELDASGKIQEALALSKEVIQFNDETIKLNQALPLNTKAQVDEYYKLAVKQASTYQSLEKQLAPAKPTIKQALLNRIDVQEKALKEAIAKFERRSAHFYAKILLEVQTQLNKVREHAQALPDAVNQGDVFIGVVEAEVQDLERVVPSRTNNPSPYTLQKTDALYGAAMNAKDHRNVSQALVDKVIEIVNFEKVHASELVAQGPRFDVQQQALYTQQNTLYWELLQLIIRNTQVPRPEKNEELAARAVRKIEALTGQGHTVEASMLQNELNQFVGNEKTMNQLLPVDETTTVQSYFEAASRHNLGRINIEILIAKTY